MLSNLAELISAEDNLIPCSAPPQKVEDGAKSPEHGICIFSFHVCYHRTTLKATKCGLYIHNLNCMYKGCLFCQH